jgi:manganese/zinc/iron transport system permease protein
MLLRRRSLVGDVVGHASLPGIAIAFLVMEAAEPGSGKSLSGLLIGALVAGWTGVLCTTVITRYTRIKDDAALAIVLSIFFGLGVALLSIIQTIPSGSAAGLNHFIFGKAASMIADDVMLIAKAAVVVLILSALLFKELTLLCFDEEFAGSQGWPVARLDLILMALVVVVAVIGLQSVGLLLVVAMLILPAAAARFWSDRLPVMTLISAGAGGLGACCGTIVSALVPRLAAGAIIVLVSAMFFALSMLFGLRRGIVPRLMTQWRLNRRVGRHDLLRAFYEQLESSWTDTGPLPATQLTKMPATFDQLLIMRSWNAVRVQKLLDGARRSELIQTDSSRNYRLTPKGAEEAQRVVRNHRLWELYLISHADIAPSHVDRDADEIEHVLEPELIEELDNALVEQYPEMAVPPSPHPIGST